MNFFFLYLMARNDTPSYVARGNGATETHAKKLDLRSDCWIGSGNNWIQCEAQIKFLYNIN